jgi:hypothetical protein
LFAPSIAVTSDVLKHRFQLGQPLLGQGETGAQLGHGLNRGRERVDTRRLAPSRDPSRDGARRLAQHSSVGDSVEDHRRRGGSQANGGQARKPHLSSYRRIGFWVHGAPEPELDQKSHTKCAELASQGARPHSKPMIVMQQFASILLLDGPTPPKTNWPFLSSLCAVRGLGHVGLCKLLAGGDVWGFAGSGLQRRHRGPVVP